MLIRPEALPDELDRGYLGRVIRWNGKSSEKEIFDLMRHWAGQQDKSRREVSTLELLSKVAGVSMPKFVMGHGTLPLRRAITSYQPNLLHGSLDNRSMLWTTGMRLARPGAYSCEDCEREDIGFHGNAYWRREHQTPGLLWCPKHGTPLRYLEVESAFLYSPSEFGDQYKKIPHAWVSQARSNEFIQRFLDIASGLMERESPLDVRLVSSVLKEKATAQGYHTNGGAVRAPLLSDAVVDAFGTQWLSTILPALVTKQRGVLLHQLDGVTFMKTSASSVNAYILAAAVLFDTADDALNAMFSASGKEPVARSRKATFIDGEVLLEAYIQGRGNYSEVALTLSLSRPTVASRLRALGLPNLSENSVNQGSLIAVISFYVDGKSLSESARAGGVSIDDMDNLVRAVGTPFTRVLREMQRPTGRGTGVPRQRLRLF